MKHTIIHKTLICIKYYMYMSLCMYIEDVFIYT